MEIYHQWEVLAKDIKDEKGLKSSPEIYVAKFATSMAMHLSIFKEFDRGRIILKYILNSPEKFHRVWIPFLLGLCHVLFCFVHEFINMIILFNTTSVKDATAAYLTVGLVTQMNQLFYNTTVDNDTENVVNRVFDIKFAPVIKQKAKKDKFTQVSAEETLGLFYKYSKRCKLARLIYAIIRGAYASLSFYFVPFLYIVF